MNELKILNVDLSTTPDETSYGMVICSGDNWEDEKETYVYVGAKHQCKDNEDLIKHILTNGMKISVYDLTMLIKYVEQIDSLKGLIADINNKVMFKKED